ncbi:MAG: hypothetical protein MUC68_14225 [Burkholderiaceae bacterium]|nr:hypothetical protein [Burkholderiaceae bacterium]
MISPLPQYVATWESHRDPLAKKYPLQLYGLHGHGRTHSTYHNVPWLRELHPDRLLINPVDAQSRGLSNGDLVRVFNDRGAIEVPARVTPRIMPGVVSVPQGASLAKANPQHTNLVEVRKA